jgi:NAD(P)-dependent dehydrogenase (short-subunit alcohol dehydrogenase family)
MESSAITLTGKTGIITGASRGLGKAIALGMAGAGANVVLASRNVEANEKIAEQIRLTGSEALAVRTDVTKTGDLKELRDRCLETFGRIDILVNNAGISPSYKRSEFIEEDVWDTIMQTDVKAVFFCSQIMGQVMRQQNAGKIINIASTAGVEGMPRLAAYAAAKAGVINLTRTLALEWASCNINVNAVAPGIFEVGLGEPILQNDRIINSWLSHIPQGRVGRKEEISGAVIFLASDSASYITGHILIVDGGWTAGHLIGIRS